MKKFLILMVTILSSLTLFSQEKREYELINETKVEVKVYRDEILKEKGHMVNIGDKWVNDGIWLQYDKNGNINLKVKYLRGKRQWSKKRYNDYVMIIKKEDF